MSRREQGVALVTVIVVLVAMALIATPFAVSMRNLESGALLTQGQVEARAGALTALAAARRHLEDTHPFYDLDTPHFDPADEIAPASLATRFADLLPRDPKGALRSAQIEDEQGKVHLGTASIWLLGNLLGGRTWLTAGATAEADTLALADTDGFPEAGLALVGGEQVEYSQRREQALQEVRRGFPSANVARALALPHPVGTPVLDARVVLLVQRCWRLRPGVWQPYLRVAGLKDLSLFSELAYRVEDLERTGHDLTVHGGPARWRDPQRLIGVGTDREGLPQVQVPDGSRCGPGTVLRLQNDNRESAFNLVLAAVDWGDHWRLSLLEELDERMRPGEALLTTLVREPVNLNTASRRVLEALLVGVGRSPVEGVITDLEAAHLAAAIVESEAELDSAEFRQAVEVDLDAGNFDTADLQTAARVLAGLGPRGREQTLEELAGLLAGRLAERGTDAVGAATAARLAGRIATGRPSSQEDLGRLLAAAVAAGDCTEAERQSLLRCALDPGDARISGGTAPFTYASRGLFTIEAASSVNLPNGKERSRAHVRQILSPGVPGETAHLLATQRDFEAATERGSAGWASWPNVLATGPGPAASPELPGPAGGPPSLTERDESLPAADWRGALALGPLGVGRADGVIAGRHGPSDDETRSSVGPAPVRSSLPDTLHFDEGATGLLGVGPEGYDLGLLPIRQALAELQPAITGSASGRLQPFAVEFWFELEDTAAETVLFDLGSDHLENRVFLMMSGGELVFRVSDTSIADFGAIMPEGHAPPAGEIRYAFDDGLELAAGVPYHVLASVGGARDTALLLLVDGVPRGRRSFATRLTEELGAVGAFGQGAAIGNDTVAVESAAGFPARGVLRIGGELLEYVDRDEDSFDVRPASAVDPFGGRARRGTTGPVHEVSELVELVGYSRPLASLVANQGNGTLDGRLAEFDVAEIDPARATDDLFLLVSVITGAVTEDITIPLGTGIDLDTATLPVRSPYGAALDGVFQAGGGHAVIFCDYGNTGLVGQPISPEAGATAELPGVTDRGAWVGGAEVIKYQSFDGSTLQGCSRQAAGIPVSIGPQPSSLEGASNSYVANQGTAWEDPRAWVTTFSPELIGAASNPPLPAEARVFVIPISVAVDGGNLYEKFQAEVAGRGTSSSVVQVGLDFPEGGGGTEWIRWNTPTTDALVRDDAGALDRMLLLIAGTDFWRMDTQVPTTYPDSLNNAFEFRGQDGTPVTTHETTETVLPTLVLGAWGIAAFDPVLGIPGRHDATSLVGDDGSREWHVINHASNDDTEYGRAYALVGFREPVLGDFAYTPQDVPESYPLDDLDIEATLRADGYGDGLMESLQVEDAQSLRDAVRSLQAESRQVTRLLKAPSGELPDGPLPSLHLGEDFDHRRSAGAAVVDELRLHVTDVPGPLLPGTARYRLDEELLFEEDDVLVLALEALLYPHAELRSSLLGKDGLQAVAQLPQSGGLLLVGEEIVAYAGLDPDETGSVFLTGRGLYGTARAYHGPGEPVLPLLFWPASPLVGRADAESSVLPVADPESFPAQGGLVWVGDELVGYDAVSEEGLLMPVRPGRGVSLDRGFGLLRGRFGTVPSEHDAGSMVRWQPMRLFDQALLGDDVPEAHGLRLALAAPGTYVTDVALAVVLPDPLVELDARVVLDDLASPHADPTGSTALFAVPPGGKDPGLRTARLLRQADWLELYLAARWLPGAFDMRDHGSNAWKLGPRVQTAVVRGVQPTVVLSHEEWR